MFTIGRFRRAESLDPDTRMLAMRNIEFLRGAALALGAVSPILLAHQPEAALAQPAETFFRGKVINLYIGYAPGGTYDYFGRLSGRFIGKHIRGSPTTVVQNMPGAGSLQAANYSLCPCPQDGTAWGVVTQTLAIEEALRSPAVRYKPVEFTWIGRITSALEVYFTWKTSKAGRQTTSELETRR